MIANNNLGRHGSLDAWRTPPELFETLNREFKFFLDAACDTTNCLAPTGLYVDRGCDARLHPWRPGPVWCNPPYGDLPNFVWLAERWSREQVVVMLLPADPSTRWWIDVVAEFACEVRFVTGRLWWLTPQGKVAKNTAGKPSAVVVFDPERQGPPEYSYVDREGNPLAVGERAAEAVSA